MEVIPERGDIWWVALDPTLAPRFARHAMRGDFGEGAQRKAKDSDRRPAVEFAEGQSADPDPDLL